jgi:hypothetical protein
MNTKLHVILYGKNGEKALRLVFWPKEEEGNEEKYITEDSSFKTVAIRRDANGRGIHDGSRKQEVYNIMVGKSHRKRRVREIQMHLVG